MGSLEIDPAKSGYWLIDGEPTVLLGGSIEDNIFQVENVELHLDALVAAGGNYLRCTLSCRDEGDAWPFAFDSSRGLYDLTRVEGPFWDRFDRFIALTRERGIVVQIELFDRFDYARGPWKRNPFNPANNVNYDTAASGLKTEYSQHPGTRQNPFFRSLPTLEDNPQLLRFQEAFVARVLQTTLSQPHVLYCISNETGESPLWGYYWAEFIRERARQAGTEAYVTEMWNQHDPNHPQHAATWQNPQTYAFIDVSQINHYTGQEHWDKLMAFRAMLIRSAVKRPMNMVKIYGANSSAYGTTRDAQERFWRSLLAGVAAVRFHRPPTGLGLSEIAASNIRAARMLAAAIDLPQCRPEAGQLQQCSPNEAYTTGLSGKAHAVFFPDGGDLFLVDTTIVPETSAEVRWLDIRAGEWSEPKPLRADEAGGYRLLSPREEGYWLAVVRLNPTR